MSIATILPPRTVGVPTENGLAVEGRDRSGRAVDQRRMHDEPALGVRHRLLDDRPRAVQLPRALGAEVDAQDDVRVEHLQSRSWISVTFLRPAGSYP